MMLVERGPRLLIASHGQRPINLLIAYRPTYQSHEPSSWHRLSLGRA